jgi:hypothetical protein
MRNTTTSLDSSRQARATHLWREQVVLPRRRGTTAESVASPLPNHAVERTGHPRAQLPGRSPPAFGMVHGSGKEVRLQQWSLAK